MSSRKIVTLALVLVFVLALALFVISKYAPLLLPTSVSSDVYLLGVVITAAAAILSALKDVIELIDRFVNGRKEQFQEWVSAITRDRAAATHNRNREIMIKKVEVDWVEGVLENSLHGAVLLQLGMKYKPDMVVHLWDTILQRPHQLDQILPEGTKIINVFDTFGGSFLILGDPGSGKTTALLELTRDLLLRAKQDVTYPIPVVFNLSSWTLSFGGIEDWLINELNSKYQVPTYVSRAWIDSDELLLLFDGLDELREEHRDTCVNEINRFRTRHMVNLVVCSRTEDYKTLTNRLVLSGAIIQQPLTDHQIDEYLRSLGKELKSVRIAVQADMALQQLARSPLVLSIIAMAYQGMTLDDLRPGTLEERRNHLFATYIERMFEHRKITGRYKPIQITRRLVWLGKLMQKNAQTVFRIEQLQPDAFSNATPRVIYVGFVTLAIWSLLLLSMGFACGLAVYNVTKSLTNGIVTGILYGLIAGLGMWIAITGCYQLKYRALLGLVVGAALAFTVWIFVGSYLATAIISVMGGSVITFGYGKIGGSASKGNALEAISTINTVRKRLSWSWRTGRIGFAKRLPLGLLFGIAGGVSSGFVFGWSFGLAAGIGFSLTFAVAGAISYGMIDVNVAPLSKPNEGTWRSFENALRFGTISGVWIGIIFGWLVGVLTRPITGFITGVAFFIAGFIIAGLIAGGFSVIQHCTLRFLLFCFEDVPLRYPDFLNRAIYHIFLRKVGGGYIFVHRLLLEYFAAQEPTSQRPMR